MVGQFLFRFVVNRSLNRLAIAVLRIEEGGQFLSFLFIAGEQKTQGLFRRGQASRRIQPRPEPKPNVFGYNRRADGGDFH